MNAINSILEWCIEMGLGWIYEVSEPGLEMALFAGIYAGLLAGVVLLVNLILRKWLTAGQKCLLWGLVLTRLLMPLAPPSYLSLQNVFVGSEDQPAIIDSNLRRVYEEELAANSTENITVRLDPPNSSTEQEQSRAEEYSWLDTTIDVVGTMLPLIWLGGGAFVLLSTTIAQWRFSRRVRRAPICLDPRIVQLWKSCCTEIGLRRTIPIICYDALPQPALMGLLRPKLLLPSHVMSLGDQELRMIMLHELAHVRRCDVAWNWLLVLVRAIHWWNPVYLLAVRRFSSLREQACDVFVIRRTSGEAVRSYSELLLTLVERQPAYCGWRVTLPASILGFFPSLFRKRAIRQRLAALRSADRTRGRWQMATVFGLIVLMALSGLTDARISDLPTSDKPYDWLSGMNINWNNWDVIEQGEPEPSVTCSYDVEKVIERIAQDEGSIDDAHTAVNSSLVLILISSSGKHNPLTDETAQEKIKLSGATLTVDAPLPQQRRIEHALKAWEQSGLGQIAIEVRFVSLPFDPSFPNFASGFGFSWHYLEACAPEERENFALDSLKGKPTMRASAASYNYTPLIMATLNQTQSRALVYAVQGSRRANILQAPKVTVLNGLQASIADISKTPFVVGLRQKSDGVQEPKIVVLEEGTKLTLRATRQSELKKIHLEGRIEFSSIGDVQVASTGIEADAAKIQIPSAQCLRIDIASEVADGESLLIGCPPRQAQKNINELYLLLTPRLVDERLIHKPEGKTN